MAVRLLAKGDAGPQCIESTTIVATRKPLATSDTLLSCENDYLFATNGCQPIRPQQGNVMNSRSSMARIAPMLILFAFCFLAGSAKSYAQEAEVKAAIDAYHGALEARDLSKMAPLWAHDAKVMLVNPTNDGVSVGWDAVQKNWQTQFNALSELKLTQIDGPHIQVRGGVAWSMGVVKAEVKFKSGTTACASTFETDVFEKGSAGWLLVSHIVSIVPEFSD